ncbi:MAG: T9SS type A sorting domain-containing protein [Flavobacteriales bacterium]
MTTTMTITGAFTDESSMGRKFCLPLSTTELLPDYCDLENATGDNFIQCTPVAGASAYQFWIYDPHGNNEWNFVRTSPMLGPAPMANIPQGVNVNVRVRAMVNGEYLPFGPACRLSTAGQPQLHQRGVNATMASKGEFQVWPNPNNGERLSINLSGADGAADQAEVILFDATGRQAYATVQPMANGTLGTVLDLGNIGSGVYLLRITAGGEAYESRVLVVND